METGNTAADATLRDRLQATLGDAYVLERELVGGAMARVFVAVDVRLGRRVVVKVLPPELTAELSAQRFEREVRVAARLQHPNIVPLLGADERAGLAYYTMPYVEGESLRAHLLRERRLPVETIVSILRDVARALEYAHAHHVVHRDIKPDNILLTGTAAAVADFGIAKALDAALTHASDAPPDDGSGSLTRVGMAVGSPAYAAPEQAAGDPGVDARADIYAWGVVAYELLAGTPPFAGRTHHQLVAAHMSEPAPSLAPRAPNAPAALIQLVMRCLEKDPTRRPQSARDLLDGIEATRLLASGERMATPSRARRTVAMVGVVATLAAATVVAFTMYRAREHAGPAKPVLAVLPFENTGDAADAYFADGVTDEVRSRLTRISGLQVIGGTSARQYRHTTKSAREIGEELGATHLLTGTVRWERTPAGGRVRVSTELVRASDQASIWSEPVDATLGDVFGVQGEVAERVAAALDVVLVPGERRAVSARPTTNLAAYDAYLRGIANDTHASKFSAAENHATVAQFERAVALDPAFAAAWARLAFAYMNDESLAGDPSSADRARANARRATQRAWALDSSLVEARLARARILADDGDLPAAHRLVRQASADAPGNVAALTTLANAEWRDGHHDVALAAFRRATELDPRAASAWGDLALSLEQLNRYPESIQAHERELALAPNTEVAYAVQASSYLLWRADTTAARRTIERAGPEPAWIVRFPSGIAGIALWERALPPGVRHARDTVTLVGYEAGAGGLAPELFHLMKLRHYQWTGRPDRARAHADSLVRLLEPVLRGARDRDQAWHSEWFSQRSALAEAYATLGRFDDARRENDRYVDEWRMRARAVRGAPTAPLCSELHNAAYVDVVSGRADSAIARLGEALRAPCGHRISAVLLRADPAWAPLRGEPAFERLLATR